MSMVDDDWTDNLLITCYWPYLLAVSVSFSVENDVKYSFSFRFRPKS